MSRDTGAVEDLLRELAPRVLATLVRRYSRFDACEDAVQEALLHAARRWPEEGVPEQATGWLITVASRRLIDQLRRDTARQRREQTVHRTDLALLPSEPEPGQLAQQDDTLLLLFLCCHPALTAPSQLALTLRAVGGLSTAEIARSFLVPESTVAQRISRAKQRIREAGARFEPPPPAERHERLGVVLHVVYLVFTEGHTATSGEDASREELTTEAIRLARAVHRALPDDGEVTGLLALLLLTDARRAARTGPSGELIPLAEQDRSRWDRAMISEGIALLEGALSRHPVGPYQLQAAIAAVHAEATRAEDTDWSQIVALYRILERCTANPVVTLNLAVATAMVDGPRAGLALVEALDGDRRLADHHRLHAVRAHLLDLAGERAAAAEHYRAAARRTTSAPERRFLERRAALLSSEPAEP